MHEGNRSLHENIKEDIGLFVIMALQLPKRRVSDTCRTGKFSVLHFAVRQIPVRHFPVLQFPILQIQLSHRFVFWATVCKTVRPILSDRCLSVCLSVCLWRWCIVAKRLDGQDETWHAGRPRPWPHCVTLGTQFLLPKGGGRIRQFLAHICCGQMAAGIKMPLGMEIGLGPSHIVLDGDTAPPKGGTAAG